MDEIKLWKVGGTQADPAIAAVSAATQTKTEEMLEEILVKAPNLLLEGLKLVGRQVETSGSGILDLLGVDEDGQLIVFELKRGTLTREAVAQVIDYASYLAELSTLALSEFISKGPGKYGIEKINFNDWYEDQFAGKSIEAVGKPRMMLVGLGADERAKRMVEFLAARDIDISMITFHAFSDADGTYLAKQIEVMQKQTITSSRASKQTNLQALERWITDLGVRDFFNAVAGFFRIELTNSYEWPNQRGYGYYLQDISEAGTPTNRGYISLSVPQHPKGSLLILAHDRAIQVAGQEWQQITQKFSANIIRKKGHSEIKLASEQNWKQIEPDIRKLCKAILAGRQKLQEERLTAERLELEQQLKDVKEG